MKERIRGNIIKLLEKTDERLRKMIDDYDIVSFDIFDTLVLRIVPNPADIFDLVSAIYNSNHEKYINYKEIRLNAEKKARQISNTGEVNIFEIYAQMNEISEDQQRELMSLEMSVEEKSIVPNQRMIDIYNECIQAGKKTIITSDMYLPYNFIEHILNMSGVYNYEKIYLSNVLNQSKFRGDIFQTIRKDYPSSRILHLGDKLKSDYFMPIKKGVKAALIKCSSQNTYYNKNYAKKINRKGSGYPELVSFITNTIPENYDDYQKIGYEIIGPILYGFSKWLGESCKQDNIDNLFFLAREGDLLRRAYLETNKEKRANTSYLRVSRMATSIPCLDKVKTLDELIRRIYLPRAGTVIDLLESCGLTSEVISQIIAKSQTDTEYPVIEFDESRKKRVFDSAMPFISDQAKIQRIYIDGYMRQENFNGRCGIVDVGWKGTMQNNLEDLYPDMEIQGYYIGLRKDKAAVRNNANNRHGFLFGNETEVTETQRKLSATLSVFENFFLSTDGSTLRYEEKNGKYYPVLNKPEHDEKCSEIVSSVQEAAMCFVEKFAQSSLDKGIRLTEMDCFAGYDEFAVSPSLKAVELMRPFTVYNTETTKLVSEHSILYYMYHPKSFYKDFLNNTCKVFFLKSVFLLPLPYYRLWKWLHSFDKNPINPIN